VSAETTTAETPDRPISASSQITARAVANPAEPQAPPQAAAVPSPATPAPKPPSGSLTTASPIPLPNVVDKVATFVKRFVFLKEPSLYRLLALWIIHTYLIDEFEYTGYVFAYSPEPESGKTRLLDVLHVLVHNSSGILASPTEAVLFRTAKDHTQLLDEADTWMNMQSIKGVLNAGSKRGGTVSRMDKLVNGGYKPAVHQVFAPRAIAGIGIHILAPATRSRTFEIEMIRQRRDERRERFRAREVGPDAAQLVATIKGWIDRNKSGIALRCREPFSYLDRFGDRTVDICEPLAAVLEVVFQDTTELDQARFDLIDAITITRKEQTESIMEHRILSALTREAETDQVLGGPLVGTASELAARCSNSGMDCNEYEVSRTLRMYGFATKSIRREDGSKKRYSLTCAELNDVCTRYLRGSQDQPEHAAATEVTTSQPLEKVGT
jgi:hypothetical protein